MTGPNGLTIEEALFIAGCELPEKRNFAGIIVWASRREISLKGTDGPSGARIRRLVSRFNGEKGPSGIFSFPILQIVGLIADLKAFEEEQGRPASPPTLPAFPVRETQKALAENFRAATGRRAHGQLWQECEKRGCDTEPVCMNCFYCGRHCTCTD